MILKILTAIFTAAALTAAAADIVPINAEAPEIDGNASDSVWKNQEWKKFEDIEYKTSSDGTRIYFIVRFKSPEPHTEERRWTWDKKSEIYVPGKEAEDLLNIIISPENEGVSQFADLWVWRAGRTDPISTADDLYISFDPEGAAAPQIFSDKGQISWYSRYFSDYAGDLIKRFYLRKPYGSAADVSAKGSWNDGLWTVEFSRKLDTGNIDDLKLSQTDPFRIYFSTERELPVKFRSIPMQFEKGAEAK